MIVSLSLFFFCPASAFGAGDDYSSWTVLNTAAVTVPSDFLGMHFHYWPQARPGNSVTSVPTFSYGLVRNLAYLPFSSGVNMLDWASLNPTSVSDVASMYASASSQWTAFDTWCQSNASHGAHIYWELYGTPAHAAGAQYQVAGNYNNIAESAPPDTAKMTLFLQALFQRASSAGCTIGAVALANEIGNDEYGGEPVQSVDVSGNIFTLPLWLSANNAVFFTSTGSLPGGLSANTVYYTLDAGTTTRVSTSQGGGAVDITSAGSGTIRMHRVIEGWWGTWAEQAATQKVAYQTIKSLSASTKVYSPSFWGASAALKWLQTSDGSGGHGSDWCDGIAIHPYDQDILGTDASGAATIMDSFRTMLSTNGYGTKTIAVSEWGFDAGAAYLSQTDSAQAMTLARILAIHAAKGAQTSIPYAADDGSGQSGLMSYIGATGITSSSPKTAVMAAFQAAVPGKTIVANGGRIDPATGEVHLQFSDGSSYLSSSGGSSGGDTTPPAAPSGLSVS